MTKQRWLPWSVLPLSLLLTLPSPALSQRAPQKQFPRQSLKKDYKMDRISKMNPANPENPVILSKSNYRNLSAVRC